MAIAAIGCGSSSESADPGGGGGGAPADAGTESSDDGGPLPQGCTTLVSPGGDDDAHVQAAVINAKDGDVICFAAGRFHLADEVQLTVSNVTLRGATSATDGGKGEDGTIFDFTGQQSGGNGILVTANGTTVESIRIENPGGNGVRANQVEGITFRGVRVVWTGGPATSNGGYGVYPVQSSKVLVENCYVLGASDTGVYVGQSNHVVVRNNDVEQNVAGIELENTSDAEVYGNHCHDNVGGILVFNLPGLAVMDGKRALVHDNLVENNNIPGFAAPGNIVAMVPSGTGFLIMAADDNEIRNNTVTGNQSLGLAIISWKLTLKQANDPTYDIYPEGNYVHDNSFENDGTNPQGQAALIAQAAGQTTIQDLVWDGVVDPDKNGEDGSLTNCFQNNGAATFMDMDWDGNFAGKSTDVGPYTCSHPALPPIEL